MRLRNDDLQRSERHDVFVVGPPDTSLRQDPGGSGAGRGRRGAVQGNFVVGLGEQLGSPITGSATPRAAARGPNRAAVRPDAGIPPTRSGKTLTLRPVGSRTRVREADNRPRPPKNTTRGLFPEQSTVTSPRHGDRPPSPTTVHGHDQISTDPLQRVRPANSERGRVG